MKLKIVLTTLCLGVISFSYAQKSERIIKQPTPNQSLNTSQTSTSDTIGVNNYSRTKSPQLSTKSVDNTVSAKNNSLLQELYSIEDDRNTIENDNSFSSSERNKRINEINSTYNLKKTEFVNYVNSKGILNVSKQEQSYFLSILKSENNVTEYNKNIELINQSK
jgi:hypothetical protein